MQWKSIIFALCAYAVPFIVGSKHNPSPLGYTFYKGHDISSLAQEEALGRVYRDGQRGNIVRPLEDILGDGGMNAVRLRMWVNPPLGNYSLEYTLDLASRLYKQGYEIYLDYHFSDNWADPGKQWTPTAWPKELKPLSRKLRSYVKDTLLAFKKANVDLAVVSLGNEITNGILWPAGRVDLNIANEDDRIANFTNLASLLSSARRGVDDAVSQGFQKPEVMLHLSYGWNKTLQSNFYESLTATGEISSEDWDSFGLSAYPYNGTNARWTSFRETLALLAHQYRKPIHVAETDYIFYCTTNNATTDFARVGTGAEGQLEWMRRVINLVRNVPYGLGRGVWTWEPAWLTSPRLGSQCEDAINFDPETGISRKSVEMFLD